MDDYDVYDKSGNYVGTAHKASDHDSGPSISICASIFYGFLLAMGFAIVEASIDLYVFGNFIAKHFSKGVIFGHWAVAWIIAVVILHVKQIRTYNKFWHK